MVVRVLLAVGEGQFALFATFTAIVVGSSCSTGSIACLVLISGVLLVIGVVDGSNVAIAGLPCSKVSDFFAILVHIVSVTDSAVSISLQTGGGAGCIDLGYCRQRICVTVSCTGGLATLVTGCGCGAGCFGPVMHQRSSNRVGQRNGAVAAAPSLVLGVFAISIRNGDDHRVGTGLITEGVAAGLTSALCVPEDIVAILVAILGAVSQVSGLLCEAAAIDVGCSVLSGGCNIDIQLAGLASAKDAAEDLHNRVLVFQRSAGALGNVEIITGLCAGTFGEGTAGDLHQSIKSLGSGGGIEVTTVRCRTAGDGTAGDISFGIHQGDIAAVGSGKAIGIGTAAGDGTAGNVEDTAGGHDVTAVAAGGQGIALSSLHTTVADDTTGDVQITGHGDVTATGRGRCAVILQGATIFNDTAGDVDLADAVNVTATG